MVAVFATIAAVILALGAEAIHLTRVKKLGGLAFGHHGKPRLWARTTPAMRVVAIGLLCWGLITLFSIKGKTHNQSEIDTAKQRHVVILLDVSPSMRLVDAGTERDKSRMARAREVIESLFDRVPIQQYKISCIAFFSKAIPVVVDTKDMEVVKNILNDLPMHYAFKGRQTDLFAALEEASNIVQPWQPKSTILLIVSDGDTVPGKGMPKMPPSVASSLVIGVGDPLTGTFIAGANSRQDISTLRQVAARMNGEFHNGNTKHITSNMIEQLTAQTSKSRWEDFGEREYALMAIAIGAMILSLVPFLLHYGGAAWSPGIRVARHIRVRKPGEIDVEAGT